MSSQTNNPTASPVTDVLSAAVTGETQNVRQLIEEGADVKAVRPFSIYRHTPVFRHHSSTAVRSPQPEENERKTKTNPKVKPKRNKVKEDNVVKAEDIEGYRGDTQDLDSLLQFIDGEDNKKKSKKASEKVAKKNTKLSSKSDVGKDKTKLRKKNEKSRDFEEKRTSASLVETVPAPSSDVSGHVSGGPSTSTISSTKETGKISPARSFNILE